MLRSLVRPLGAISTQSSRISRPVVRQSITFGAPKSSIGLQKCSVNLGGSARISAPQSHAFATLAAGKSANSGGKGYTAFAGMAVTGVGSLAALWALNNEVEQADTLQKLGVKELLREHRLARKIKLGHLFAVGCTFKERVYEPEDPKIAEDPVRKQWLEDTADEPGLKNWVEATGVMEVGAAKALILPLGSVGNASVGFDGKSLLQYKVFAPLNASLNPSDATNEAGRSWTFPTSREDLLSAAPGTEFEIHGHGKIKGRAGLGPSQSATGPVLTASVAAGVGANAVWEGKILLKIKVLDSAGKIECSVIRDDKEKQSIDAKLVASLGLDRSQLPPVGEGFLAQISRAHNEGIIKKHLKSYGRVSFEAHWSQTNGRNALGRYLIDTSTPDGLHAFEGLLGLDVETANLLCGIDKSGVESVGYLSTLDEAEKKLVATWGKNHLAVYRALEAERYGVKKRNGKVTKFYREHEAKQIVGNFIAGKQEVEWDAITFVDGDEAPSTFYNLKYSNHDKITTEAEIERFFRFANALGISHAHQSERELDPNTSLLERILSSDDDTKVDVDIFFTKAGISKIAQASDAEVRRTLFEARALFDEEAEGLAEFSDFDFSAALQNVEGHRAEEMRAYCEGRPNQVNPTDSGRIYRRRFGRDLDKDLVHLENVAVFMAHKADLEVDATPEARREFFADLGESKGFGFMPSILALAKLAGDDETVINTLRMRGAKVALEAVSEGCVAHRTQVEAIEKRR